GDNPDDGTVSKAPDELFPDQLIAQRVALLARRIADLASPPGAVQDICGRLFRTRKYLLKRQGDRILGFRNRVDRAVNDRSHVVEKALPLLFHALDTTLDLVDRTQAVYHEDIR